VVDVRDVITSLKFGDDRFRDLASAEGQILPLPIDFDGHPYNTLTLPCERVIKIAYLLIVLFSLSSLFTFTLLESREDSELTYVDICRRCVGTNRDSGTSMNRRG